MSSPPPPATNTTTPPPAVSPLPPVASAPPPSTPTSPPPPDLSPPPPASGSPPPPPSSTPLSPPPPSSLSNSPPPPTPSSSSTPSPPSSSSSSSSSSLTSSAIIGIAIGGVVILLVFALLCICCTKKRRRRRNDHGNEHYYIPPPPPPAPPKDGYYGGAAQHWQQSNPPPAEQYAMPKPSPPAARPPPSLNRPPTPTFMNSSGGSASNYSGSGGPLRPPSLGMEFGFSKNAFTYEELERATEGFSDDNLLGQGGFGYVHKGVLPNGKEVAVKSLKAGSVQGDREFQAEVEIISRVHHKHLVSLVGYCIAGAQRMLVYEFVPNKTLEFHLHGKGHSTMNWQTRLKIALGSAKGLAYLHEDCHPKIIHRDITAANILLDFKFEAKVADFGLAKFSSDLNTHISTRVMGTFGYLAPEYASSGKLTDKSDVYSYGVMLLELITGHRPFDTTNTCTDDCLVDWVNKMLFTQIFMSLQLHYPYMMPWQARPLLTRALEDHNFDSVVDRKLQTSYNQNEMARMVACAAACVRHSARRRPRMSQVVRALEGDVSLSDLNDGVRPGHSTAYGSYGSSDYDSSQYKEDMKKFRQTAFTRREHGSSEYGDGTTSENGVNPSRSSNEAQTTRGMEMAKVKTDSQGFSATGSTDNTTGEAETENAR